MNLMTTNRVKVSSHDTRSRSARFARTQWRRYVHSDAHPGNASSKLEGPLIAGAEFQWKPGGISINSTLEIVEPDERIGWTGTAIGTQARHVWTLKPHKDGTLLTTEESMDGWLARALKVMMPGFLEDSLDIWLQSLKKQVENV